jgi:hypothetical protein
MSITRNDNGTYSLTKTVTVSALELYLSINAFEQEIAQLDMAQLAKDAGQPVTTPPPPVTPPPTTPTGFKGVFAFNTGNVATFATNPSIAGTELAYYWSQLEPTQGQYNWSLIDNDMQAWVANRKKITLRVKTAGWTNWQPPYSQKGTPQYVFDQGVKYVTDPDKAIKPQYWSGAFLSNLATFVKALADRYDGHPNILAIEIAVGDGGETKPSTNKQTSLSAWQAIGYTDAQWWMAIQQIIQIYAENFTKTPLALMPDASFIGGTNGYDESLVVNYAAKYGVWLQWNGLVAGASLPGSFSGLKVPIVCEQLNAAGQNGRSFLQDAQTAIKLGAVVMLAFTSDLEDTNNAAALKQIAAIVVK